MAGWIIDDPRVGLDLRCVPWRRGSHGERPTESEELDLVEAVDECLRACPRPRPGLRDGGLLRVVAIAPMRCPTTSEVSHMKIRAGDDV